MITPEKSRQLAPDHCKRRIYHMHTQPPSGYSWSMTKHGEPPSTGSLSEPPTTTHKPIHPHAPTCVRAHTPDQTLSHACTLPQYSHNTHNQQTHTTPHTHPHMHSQLTHYHTRTATYIHANAPIHSPSNIHTHTNTHLQTRTLRTHSLSHSHTHIHFGANTHIHACTHVQQ